MDAEKVNSFDVLKEMSRQEKDIRLATLKNIVGVRIVGKQGQVTIAVSSDTARDLLVKKRFVGGLFIADEAEFNVIAKEMGAAAE